MEKNKFELVLAVILFLAGVFLLVFSQVRVTGGVVGVTELGSMTFMFIGFLCLTSSLVFFVANQQALHRITLDQQIVEELKRLDKRIRDFEPDNKNLAVVVDTSFVLQYRDSARNFENFLKQYAHVLVPDKVLDEVKNHDLRQVLFKYKEDFAQPKEFSTLKSEVKKFLMNTSKQRAYENLMPYLTGKKQVSSNRELITITELSAQVKRWMVKDGWTAASANENKSIFFKQMIDYLEKNCQVSEGDVAVMSTAVSEALIRGRKTAVVGRDSHLGEALPEIIRAYGKLAPLLKYVNFAESYA